MHVADKQWEELAIDHETKCLRADVCLGSPESFSLEWWRETLFGPMPGSVDELSGKEA